MFVISIFVLLITVFAYSEAQGRTGGEPAKRGDFPYHAFLYFWNVVNGPVHICGATLISDQYLLTSAHCLTVNVNSTELINYAYGLLGIVDPYSKEEGRHEILTGKDYFIIHPNYSISTYEHNIALIKLSKPVKFNSYIQIAKLPSHYQTEEELLNKTIFTTGWGRSHEADYAAANILHSMETEVVNGVECSKTYNPYNFEFYSDTQICINSPTSTYCDGDSGAPNVLKENGENVVVGITSFGFNTCKPNIPIVLTKVSYYLDWISENTGIVVKSSSK